MLFQLQTRVRIRGPSSCSTVRVRRGDWPTVVADPIVHPERVIWPWLLSSLDTGNCLAIGTQVMTAHKAVGTRRNSCNDNVLIKSSKLAGQYLT